MHYSAFPYHSYSRNLIYIVTVDNVMSIEDASYISSLKVTELKATYPTVPM